MSGHYHDLVDIRVDYYSTHLQNASHFLYFMEYVMFQRVIFSLSLDKHVRWCDQQLKEAVLVLRFSYFCLFSMYVTFELIYESGQSLKSVFVK